jgi:glutamate racemase
MQVCSQSTADASQRGEWAMTAASDTIDLDIDMTRRMLRHGRARALVVGTKRATAAVLRALRADFASPVFNLRAGGALTLPETSATLLIHEVSALDTADQHRLQQWLERSAAGSSVIAVASEPLFPLVQRGAFLPDLFYRLNLIVIDVTDVDVVWSPG